MSENANEQNKTQSQQSESSQTGRDFPSPHRRMFLKSAVGLGAGGLVFGGMTDTASAHDDHVEWKYASDYLWFNASPTIVDGTVYVPDHGGKLYALDADAESPLGELQWKIKEEVNRCRSAVTVIDETVYFAGYRVDIDNPTRGFVYALDAANGSVIWQFDVPGAFLSSPTVYDGTLYIGGSGENNTVYAIDVNSGNSVWEFETGSSVVSSPTIIDGTLFIGSNDGNLYALSAKNGDELWRFKTDSKILSSPTVADGSVYLTNNSGNLFGVNVDDGKKVWEFDLGRSYDEERSSPTVRDGRVIVGTSDSLVVAVDAVNGEKEWSYDGGTEMWSSPTVVDDTVFIGDWHSLLGIDLEEGTKTVSHSILPLQLKGISPTVVDGILYIATSGNPGNPSPGKVYAFDVNVEGSSEGSRVNQGTLGHHHVWADKQSDKNTPPSAHTGDDQTVEEQTTVTLDGTASTDPDDDSLTYSWAQTAGPDVTLEGAETPTAEFTAPDVDTETTLSFELTVDDGESTDSETIEITVTDVDGGSGPPPIVGDNPPTDVDGDGLYEDISGDGEFGINDVQIFFKERNSNLIQANSEYFNFSDGNPDEVTVGDVQSLFKKFRNWES